MRAFRYHLAVLLKRAEHRERALQLDLARLQERLAAADERLAALRAAQERLRARWRELHAAELDLRALEALGAELGRTDAVLARAAQARRELGALADSVRAELVEAARTCKVYENHRRRLGKEHYRAELAAETKRLDELANARRRGRQAPEEGGG